MVRRRRAMLAGGLAFAVVLSSVWAWQRSLAVTGDEGRPESLDWQLPSKKAKAPFAKEQPIVFVSSQNPDEWNKLKSYWNTTTELAVDPDTGEKVTRTVVKIKLPLGISQAPKIPAENPITVARWELGRDLYYDTALSSDASVSCASCHDPRLGFTDQSPVSTGIAGKKGGVSAPTVINSAYNFLQFWDGRAVSLEDQAQGPPQNPLEMFDGKGNAWHAAVARVRKKGDYTKRFLEAFGHGPTRDGIAKAIASYERTVINGNSVYDRADFAMKVRVSEDGGTNYVLTPRDCETVLKDAVAKNDTVALTALGIDAKKDAAKIPVVAKQIAEGKALFFGKARCSLCHVGDHFTDGQFHNLGVGVKDGKIPDSGLGRFAAMPTGHKNAEAYGAFKTPTLRGLLSTAPYLHDGSEDTLEKVVDFYDRGGNANEFLSPKMRDLQAEKDYAASKRNGTVYKGPEVKLFGVDQTPIAPFRLNLTPPEKAALVVFMRSLQGEVDSVVFQPTRK